VGNLGKAAPALEISSFVIVTAAAAHLLIISDYQIPTALGIASSSDVVSTLIGTIMPLVGVFLPIVLQILAGATVLAVLLARFDFGFRIFVATALSFFATLFVSPAMVSLEAAERKISKTTQHIIAAGDYTPAYLLFLLIVHLAYLRARYGRFDARYAFERAFIVLAVGSVLIYILFTVAVVSYPLPKEIKNVPGALQRVWLPAEVILTRDGSRHVGYVLSADQEWTIILEDHPRTVLRVHSNEVESRRICRTDRGPDKLPLIPNIKKPTDIELCPGYLLAAVTAP
jgi:hypothetical protein